MASKLGRRAVVAGAVGALAASSLVGCIPSLTSKKITTVNIALFTFGGSGNQQTALPLYQAVLAVTKKHLGEFDVNVQTITASAPTPGTVTAGGAGAAGVLGGAASAAASALQQALDQDPAPDVVLFDTASEFGYALQESLLQPIETYARTDTTVQLSDFFSGAIAAASDQGHLYGLPLAVQPTLLQYDRALFDAAQVSPPDETWDWNTLLNAARTLTNPDAPGGPQFGLSLSAVSAVNLLAILIWQNGGDIVSQDGRRALIAEAPAVGAIQYLYDLVQTYKVVAAAGPGAGSPAAQRARTGPGTNQGQTLIGANGRRVAMELASFGPFGRMRAGANSGVQLAELPRGKVAATTLELYGILAMTQRASSPAASYKVMASLVKEMARSMTVPSYRPMAQNLASLNPNVSADLAAILVSSLEYARSLPTMLLPKLAAPIAQQVLQPIVTGSKTPAEIAADAADAADRALNE